MEPNNADATPSTHSVRVKDSSELISNYFCLFNENHFSVGQSRKVLPDVLHKPCPQHDGMAHKNAASGSEEAESARKVNKLLELEMKLQHLEQNVAVLQTNVNNIFKLVNNVAQNLDYAFMGSWAFVESENFPEFLEAIGVNPMLRAVASTMVPTLRINIVEDTWTIMTESAVKTSVMAFKLNEEFIEKRLDGIEVRALIRVIGGVMIHRQFGDESKNLKDVTIIRRLENGHLIEEGCVGNISCTRIFIRQISASEPQPLASSSS